MVRVKRGNVAKKRRKKILKFAKGFKGAHSRLFRTANGQVMKALIYSYVGRKRRKQDFKKLWICRVNAAARNEGTNYSKLRNSLKKSSILWLYWLVLLRGNFNGFVPFGKRGKTYLLLSSSRCSRRTV